MIHFLDDYIPACRLIISQIDTNRDLLFYAHSTIITEDVAASAHYEWRRNHGLMFKKKFLIRLDIRLLEILGIHDPRLGHKRQLENQVMFFFKKSCFSWSLSFISSNNKVVMYIHILSKISILSMLYQEITYSCKYLIAIYLIWFVWWR